MTAVDNRPVGVDRFEREMVARDAHDSATLLALLVFLWGAISLFLVPDQFWVLNLVHIALGALGLLFFLATRKRPSTWVAFGYCGLVIVQALIVLPWTAIVWATLGRPWEALTVPQVAIVSMPLIIPRSFWLGAVTLALFAAEAVFVQVHAAHVGLGSLIPVGEPLVTLLFGLLGIGLLVLRERRRDLARRHIRAQAELEALRRVTPVFTSVRDQLDTELTRMSGELQRLPSGSGAKMDRAVERLAEVSRRLGALLEQEPSQTTRPGAATEAERLLVARDAQLGATTLAGIAAVVALLWIPVAQLSLGRAAALGTAGVAVIACALLFHLVRTRHRPSERRAQIVTLALVAASLPLISLNQTALVALGRPFSPFLGHKLLLVILGLAAASRRWLGILLIVATAVEALVLYFALHLGAHKDLIAVAEPGVMLVFMLVGIVALVMRDQRRAASIKVLRAESAASALQRRALLLLALRDQLNSPLQVLVGSAALVAAQKPPGNLSAVQGGIRQLLALSRELAAIEIPGASQVASFDATQALSRDDRA